MSVSKHTDTHMVGVYTHTGLFSVILFVSIDRLYRHKSKRLDRFQVCVYRQVLISYHKVGRVT